MGYKAEHNVREQSNRMVMKNTFEPEATRESNSIRRLAGPAGLLLLGFSVWATVGCVASGSGKETGRSRGHGDWYRQCSVEVRQMISIVNYVLTPEEDVGVIASCVTHGEYLFCPRRGAGARLDLDE